MHSAVLGGGWAPVAAGLVVLAVGVTLRTWAILTIGRLFKFVVVIQDGHRVFTSGPYALLRHPSYTGGLVAYLGAGQVSLGSAASDDAAVSAVVPATGCWSLLPPPGSLLGD